MSRHLRTALLLAALTATALGAAPPASPSADVLRGGAVRVALDASLLRRAEVRKHLLSGLTANFVVSIAKHRQFGRIAIRYEPWDEVFYVRATSFDGTTEIVTLRSMAELERWWSAPRLQIADRMAAGGKVRLVLEVIPFSASEEADARKWIAQSLGNEKAPPSSSAIAAPEAPSLFSAVVGSSIRRKPVLRYAWDVTLRQAAPQ
jgi:hypothetical protein